ncbi:MAG: hypothetical protein WBA74_04815 [Cyclobacteriaceae bacterium]
MKEVRKINKLEKTAILILGLLIALFSIASPYQNQFSEEDSAVVKRLDTDGDQEQSADDQQIVKALDAVPHAFHVSGLNGFTGTISEFIFNEGPENEERSSWIPKGTSKYFRTLFRYIISPNAP